MAVFVVGSNGSMVQDVLSATQYLYSGLLLLILLLFGAIYSIYTANIRGDVVVPTVTGPGGRPLPATKKRRIDKSQESEGRFSPAIRALFQCLYTAVTLTFVSQGAVIATRALIEKNADGDRTWWCGEAKAVYTLGSAFLYLYVFITLFEQKQQPGPVFFLMWFVAMCMEIIIFACDSIILSQPHKVMVHMGPTKYVTIDVMNKWEAIDLCLSGTRVCMITGSVIVWVALSCLERRAEREKCKREQEYNSEADENTPLLTTDSDSYHSNSHGTPGITRQPDDTANLEASFAMVDEDAGFYRPEKLPPTSWIEYIRGYSVFFPYMWPSKKPNLQIVVLLCFVLLALQRWVNIMVPYQIGLVTNELTDRKPGSGGENTVQMPWASLGLLILYKLLQGPSGLLGSWRSMLWIPVSQNAYRALTTSAFEHVHSLSLDFHLGKRTGEVLSALNKGASVNSFMEQVTFQVFPMIVDLFVAITYFYIRFDALYAVIVCIVTFYYLLLTIRLASKTANQRRAMSNADREEEAVKNDSIISYETVKYFNAEDFEFQRYRTAIKNFQTAEAKVTWSISSMNMYQSLVFMTGMLAAVMFGAYQVTQRQREVGDFVALITYLGQLQGPLNFFGTFYRTVQQAMISGERLLELFKQRPTVVDRPGVQSLTSCNGHVEFSKVKFAYDQRKPALRNLTFECRPGTTTALVGESGGGKSTLFRLLYRYFNCQAGNIRVDGHNVKDVTIDSIRRFIGVVPQDTILFNETLMYNLRYANQNASDEDIIQACQAASIHDKIMSFPDGYQTKVGERGLRLSGGEKQRVAIARTLLKNPKIIMLDEATSALDSHTEQQIQSRLASIGRGRTMLIIAHRLSTITHADQILVLNQGTIVEKGTHEELLELNGKYASMWNRQAKAERAAEDARAAFRKAEKLMRKANIASPGEHGRGQGQDQGQSQNGLDESSSSSDESTAPGLRPPAQHDPATSPEGRLLDHPVSPTP
ncbi:putative heavy metal tolerance protein [Rosellinia necatrix]|uniref:Putative heavy metal tolerance protein n=1 Tax=Rosellinia necatrix TaxID=77044 RepID=A0A1W2TLZ5_ROSNE|nr:putative heavy metal tolerance protein [Rosellinia necatrix]